MQYLDYFKLQSKNLLRDSDSNAPKYFPNAKNWISKYTKDTDGFTLMKAQHVVANIAGFKNWGDLTGASDAELEIAKNLFDSHLKPEPGRTLLDTSTIYTQTPDIYEEFTKYQDAPDLAYKALAPQVKDKVVLDVGVGGGRWAVRFAPIAKSILGFDTSEKYINIAREKTKTFNNVDFHIANAKDIKLPLNHFDVIFASFFFSIFPKTGQPNEELMNQYVENLWPSLKPGGKFILLEGGTGDEFDEYRFWQQDTAKQYREWVKKSGWEQTADLDTFWKFDSTEHAKKVLHDIWGDKMSSQITKPTMTQKLLIFEKTK